MSCAPAELLDSARQMLQPDVEEAVVRAVASRAYYGAFHAAKAFHEALPSPGSVGDSSGMHRQLISQLRYPTITGKDRATSIAIGNLLFSAYGTRVIADYKLDHCFRFTDAQDSIASADQILSATKLQGELTRAKSA